jgi:hypothetical protein
MSEISHKDLQTKKKRLALFTKQAKAITTSLQQSVQNSNISFLPNLLYHCKEITVEQFCQCMFHDNFKVLIKYGSAKDTDLQNAWSHILNENADLSKNDIYIKLLKITKEIAIQQSRKEIITACIFVLSMSFSQICLDELAKQGYIIKSKFENYSEFEAELNMILKRIKSIDVVIAGKEAEKQKILKDNSGTQATEEMYRKNVSAIGRMYGKPLRMSDIFMDTYITDLQILQEQYENERMRSKQYGK